MFGILLVTHDIMAQTIYDETLDQIVEQSIKLDKNYHIALNYYPERLAFTEDVLYVSNDESDTVSIISTESNAKIKDISVGRSPGYIAIDDSSHKAYVSNDASDSVSVISTINHTKIGEDIPVGDGQTYIAIDDFSHKAYVYSPSSQFVSVISTVDDKKIKDIDLRKDTNDTSSSRHYLDIDYIDIDKVNRKVYVSNPFSDSVSVISTVDDKKIKDISVGRSPTYVMIDNSSHKAYVSNYESDTVSVISTVDDTKIGEDIPVGDGPTYMVIDEFAHKAYVINYESDSVSVISTVDDKKIKDISVGGSPYYITIEAMNEVYVSNSESDSVSVISTVDDTKIGEDIPVGDGPTYIAIDPYMGAVYVSNSDSNSISVIDDIELKVVGRFFFDVNPSNSGYIKCGEIIAPLEKYFYIWSGILCSAVPNKGFEFLSWEEKLGQNSTLLINVSKSATPLESILDLFNVKPQEPESTLNVTRFGSFIANFKELPPPVPSEYWIPLYGIIASTIVGWSIPSVIRWIRSKADFRKLSYYHQRIKTLHNDGKLDENDFEDLDQLRNDIADAYSKGKINEIHYDSLKREASILYEEIFQKVPGVIEFRR